MTEFHRGDEVRVKATGSRGWVVEVSKWDVVVKLDTVDERERPAANRVVSLRPEEVERVG